MWWCIVTMTTVGYGDLAPLSEIGRAIASILLVIGLLVVAAPVIIVGGNFEKVYQATMVVNDIIKNVDFKVGDEEKRECMIKIHKPVNKIFKN